MFCVWGGFSDFFPPNGSPHFIINSGGDLAGLIYGSLIVCNSARITIQKTICRKVQIAPRNDIGREWDLFLLLRLRCGSDRSTVNPRLAGGASGARSLRGGSPSPNAGWRTGNDIGIHAHISAASVQEAETFVLLDFWEKKLTPLWTAASMLAPSSAWSTHFSSFGCACGPKGNLEDFLENIIIPVLGQSVVFSFALPHHPQPV